MKINKTYLPITALAFSALFFALWAGLLRLGWSIPAFSRLSIAHGPLMVCGFLGVLIPLERAVAIRHKWMFFVPVVAGIGWVSLLIVPAVGGILLTLGSLGMLGILGVMVRHDPRIHTVIMATGGLAWVVGNILWMAGTPIYQMVHWWEAFLILTIAGERLELNRVLRPTLSQIRLFIIISAILFIGAVVAYFKIDWGARISGFAMLVLSVWFIRNDLATRNMRSEKPLTRYIAICLFSGFLWLGVGGAFYLYFGALFAGPYYDATLHTIFIGFVISMIFGHAPIIFPAIFGRSVTFYPIYYLQLALLHLSLIARVVGDMMLNQPIRQWGGLFNEIAILLFLGITIYSIVRGNSS